MKTIELKPVVETSVFFERLEKRILAAFKKYFYEPLLAELVTPPKLKNAKEDLVNALMSGRIAYGNGKFSGSFNASISKELRELGAKWDTKSSTFAIAKSKLPSFVKNAVSIGKARFDERMRRLDKKISFIDPANVAGKIRSTDLFDLSLLRTDREVASSLKGLIVPPKLEDDERKKIASEWSNNMDLWIKDFTEKEIKRLRKDVSESVSQGDRHDTIAKKIEASYGVTSRKAKFLARQETGLLMAKFKETRYTSAGIQEYRWRCVAGSKNHPVRPSHKRLDGKIFKWQNPPITTEPDQPERRNNPGQDYNCRCAAIPLVRF